MRGAFATLVVHDLIFIAAVGGVALSLYPGAGFSFSFAAGCLWLALNFSALAWVIGALVSPERPSRLFVFAVVCAKIPASYLILFWMYRADYLEPVGLTVGLSTLPVVIFVRGLWAARIAERTGAGPA